MHDIEASVERLEDYFDAVVFLTWSDWHSEPRSNRYHYANRFARRVPVYFVQPDLDRAAVEESDSGCENIVVVSVSRSYDARQTESLLSYLRLRGVRRPLLWVYNCQFERFLAACEDWFSVFHATEDYSIPDLPWFTEELRNQLSRVLERTDLVVAVSEKVRQNYIARLTVQPDNTITLANGCDFDFWQENEASQYRATPGHGPIALYQGGINSRLDFALLESLAERMTDWLFLFCGRVDERPEAAHEMAGWRRLLERSNVRHLGERTSEEIAAAMQIADVGIIPYEPSELIKVSLPLKAYEYLAGGLPVVSTTIPALEGDPDNFALADTPSTFEAEMRTLAPSRKEPEAIRRRLAAARAAGYDNRFETLERLVTGRLNALLNRPKELNLLMLYDDAYAHVPTIFEHLNAFRRYSRHSVFYMPASDYVTWDMFPRFDAQWPEAWDFSRFDAIAWHFGMTAALPDFFSDVVAKRLAAFSGLKILFIQDEYENTNTIKHWIGRVGIDVVFTCVPEDSIEFVYNRPPLRGVEFVRTLTGFVPEDSRLPLHALPLGDRRIGIGYRGRVLPYQYGALGREKYRIGVEMKRICEARGVPVDIEVDDSKRIYGDDWYRFLGSVRATLATESGANVFDFDGSLKRSANEAVEQGVGFEDFHARHIGSREGEVRMNQISPKIFEAIVLRTALICFDGEYSGVIDPHRHYIPLNKDFSNIDEVLEKLSDEAFIEALTDRAYREIIESGRFSYRGFVASFDRLLDKRTLRGARATIYSAPFGYTKRGSEEFEGVAKHDPFEYILNDRPLKTPYGRRAVERAMEMAAAARTEVGDAIGDPLG